jgi:hypothetical protein
MIHVVFSVKKQCGVFSVDFAMRWFSWFHVFDYCFGVGAEMIKKLKSNFTPTQRKGTIWVSR